MKTTVEIPQTLLDGARKLASQEATTLRALVQEGRIAGLQIDDARVAALCRLHGVRELWTADRDFERFSELTVRNLLVMKDGLADARIPKLAGRDRA